MILEEILTENPDLIKRWSDKNVFIHKIGTDEIYGEAIDLISSPYVYEETETEIPVEENNEEESEVEGENN